jgi:hypothetical protein
LLVNNEITSLAQYVVQTYRDFAVNRKDLTAKWERNLNAFRRINNGQWKTSEGEGWRSQIFDAITKQKIMSAVAVCIDSYLAGGKIPFDLKASPFELDAVGVPEGDETPEEIQAMIDARIDKMRRKIEQQFRLCKADQAMVKHFLAGAIYGMTYAKTAVEPFVKSHYAPIPETLSPTMANARYQRVATQEDSPAWHYLTVWDVFTDYEETDLKKCHAVIHRRVLSPFQLREALDEKPGVFVETLRKTLSDHASRRAELSADSTADETPALRDVPSRKQTVRYLEYWGRIPKSILDEFQEQTDNRELWTMNAADDDELVGDMVECLVGVVNDTVVRLAILDTSEQRPFFCAKWEDNFDGQGGIGIADNTEDVQMMRNGILRLFFDNKALSANVQLAVKRELLMKKLGEFKPGQLIDIAEDCQDVRQALQQVIVQDVGETLISALQVTDQWAEDDSMVPKIQQGAGSGGRETAYELSTRLEKSGKYLAQVMRNYDDGLVEPISQWFYDWNMDDPATEGKGSWEVIATGFTSFQDRVNKLSAIRELLQAAGMVEPGQIKLIEIFKELAKMSDVDPDQFIVTEEEAAERGPDPVQEAEIAKINSETKRNETAAQKDVAMVQIEAERLKLEQLEAMKPDPEPKKNDSGGK